MTMIYVTHYPEEILSLFEQCIILQQGKIIDRGKLTEVMTSERLSRDLGTDVVIRTLEDGRLDLRVKEGRD